jgi:hypothetical protein
LGEKRYAQGTCHIHLKSAVFSTASAIAQTKRNPTMKAHNSHPRRLPDILGSAARRLREWALEDALEEQKQAEQEAPVGGDEQ